MRTIPVLSGSDIHIFQAPGHKPGPVPLNRASDQGGVMNFARSVRDPFPSGNRGDRERCIPAFFYLILSHFHVIFMDWLAAISYIAGIILLVIGVSLVFHLSAVLSFMQEILGILCLILGAVALVFGTKLARSV
jgi:hypothetical protein